VIRQANNIPQKRCSKPAPPFWCRNFDQRQHRHSGRSGARPPWPTKLNANAAAGGKVSKTSYKQARSDSKAEKNSSHKKRHKHDD
jgi:hypothetical protein